MDERSTDYGPNHRAVARFLETVERLTDEDRVVLAAARAESAEDFRADVLEAACDPLLERADAYARARRRVATAHVPGALDGARGEDAARWAGVSRLVQLAIEEALVMFVSGDLLHPNHVRELGRPWSALDAHRRGETGPA